MSLQGLDVSTSTVRTLLSTHPKDKPVYMVNLLHYRPQAQYPSNTSTAINTTPCTGVEAYHTRYIPSILPFFKSFNAYPVFLSSVLSSLIVGTETEKWDTVAIVRYERLQDFLDMMESDVYKETCMPHRLAGLDEQKLIAVENTEIPGELLPEGAKSIVA